MLENKYLVAIDFETANSNPLSACAVGMIVFLDGEIVYEFEALIKPPKEHSTFYFYNTKIHNIKAEDVKNEKSWGKIYPTIQNYIEEGVLVAHNAAFDLKILKSLNKYYGFKVPNIDYYCTVELSRRVLPYLINHRLNTVSEFLDIKLDHHNAKSDAVACGLIVYKCMNIVQVNSYESLFDITNLKPKTLTL